MIPIRDTVPSRTPPLSTVLLIMINVAVFFFELSLPPHQLQRLVYVLGVVPARFHEGGVLAYPYVPGGVAATLLTSMFLHGGWLHIIGNMWSLWLFGDNVEDRMGHGRFLLFYLLCGVAAGLLHLTLHPSSTVPTVGASGAIAGVMGAYFVLFPYARVVTLVPIFLFVYVWEVPAVLYLGLWFLSQFFSGTLSLIAAPEGGGVAFWAHVGGFVAGLLLLPFFLKKRTAYRPWYPDESVHAHYHRFYR